MKTSMISSKPANNLHYILHLGILTWPLAPSRKSLVCSKWPIRCAESQSPQKFSQMHNLSVPWGKAVCASMHTQKGEKSFPHSWVSHTWSFQALPLSKALHPSTITSQQGISTFYSQLGGSIFLHAWCTLTGIHMHFTNTGSRKACRRDEHNPLNTGHTFLPDFWHGSTHYKHLPKRSRQQSLLDGLQAPCKYVVSSGSSN